MGMIGNALPSAIVFLAFLGVVELTCPNSWLQHGNSCYFFSRTHSDWDNSMDYCRTHGGYLAEIENLHESEFLTKECVRHSEPEWWVGGKAATEGTWIWTISGHHFNYTNWQPGEPNNANINSTYIETCLELRRYFSYRWNDWTCHMKISFICEKSVNVASGPLIPDGLG